MKNITFYSDGHDLRKFIADYELERDKEAIGDAVTKWREYVADFDSGVIKLSYLEYLHNEVCHDIYYALSEVGKARLTLGNGLACDHLFDDAAEALNHIHKEFVERFK